MIRCFGIALNGMRANVEVRAPKEAFKRVFTRAGIEGRRVVVQGKLSVKY